MANPMEELDQLKELMTLVNRERAWEGLPDVKPQEILDMLNTKKTKLQDILEYAKKINPESTVGKNIGPEFVKNLADEWTFLPGDIQLWHSDFNNIRRYFTNRKNFSALTDRQQKMVESLRYAEDEFSSVKSAYFDTPREAVNAYNLREQLVGRLQESGVFTAEHMSQMKNSSVTFQEAAEVWNNDFLTGSPRYGIPDAEVADAVDNFAKEAWDTHFSGEGGNMQSNEAIMLRAQGFEGTWEEFLAERGLTDEHFEPIFDKWNEYYIDYLDTMVADPSIFARKPGLSGKDFFSELERRNPDIYGADPESMMRETYLKDPNISGKDFNRFLKESHPDTEFTMEQSNTFLDAQRTRFPSDEQQAEWMRDVYEDGSKLGLSEDELMAILKEDHPYANLDEDVAIKYFRKGIARDMAPDVFDPNIIDEEEMADLFFRNHADGGESFSNEELIARLSENGYQFAGGEDGVLEQLNDLEKDYFGDMPELPEQGEPIEEKAPEVGDTPEGPGDAGIGDAGDQPGLLGRDEALGGDTPEGGGPLADSELYIEQIDANRVGIPEDVAADLTPTDLSIMKGLEGWVGNAAEGFAIPLKNIGKYVAKWGLKQLAAAPFFMALYAIIPSNADKWLNISTGIMAALSGDPLGAILAGTVSLVNEFNRIAQRKEDNDRSYYGWKFGFTRHGKEWFPSFTGPVHRSTGALDNTVTFETIYGTGLYFQKDGAGVLRPMWSNLMGIKKFSRTDESVDDEEWGSWQYHQFSDGLSDFYFLTAAEQKNLLDHMANPETELKINGPAGNKFEKYEDKIEDYNLKSYGGMDGSNEANQFEDKTLPAQESLLDLRWAMDYIQSFNWREMPEGQRDVTLGQLPTIQRVRWHSRWTSGPDWQREKQFQYSTDPETYKTEMQKGDYWNTNLVDTNLIEETLADEMKTLWVTQRDAALTHGFEYNTGTIDDWRDVDWRFYNDPTKFDYPTDSDMLLDQLDQIAAMENRSFEDKSFLAQKSYTRYLISYVSQRGGTNDLYRYLSGSTGSDTEMQGTGSAQGMLHFSPLSEGTAGRHFIAPWMNDGEQVLPEFMTTLHDDYRENIGTWSDWMFRIYKDNKENLPEISYDYTPEEEEVVEDKKPFNLEDTMTPAQLIGYHNRISGEKDDRPDWVKLDWDPHRTGFLDQGRIHLMPGFRRDPTGKYVNDVLGWEGTTLQDYWHKWDEIDAGRAEWQKNFDNYWETEPWRDTTDDLPLVPWILDTSTGNFVKNPHFTGDDYGQKPGTPDPTVAEFIPDEDDPEGFLYYLEGLDRTISAEEQKVIDDAAAARDAEQQKIDDYYIAQAESEIAAEQAKSDAAAAQKATDDAAAAQQATIDAAATQQATDDESAAIQADIIHTTAIVQQDLQDNRNAQEMGHLTDLQEYIYEEHKSEFSQGAITPERYPWLAFDAAGNPTLKEDPVLEAQMGLPDYIKAIKSQAGVVHTAYMPEMITPGWGTKETAHTVTVP